MPPHNLLNQLRGLDTSSSTFRDQISDILYGEEYKRWMPNIQGDDLAGLVDYLDKALDILDPTSPAFRKCLQELRHICGARTILPRSSAVFSQVLTVGELPVASGGSGDVYNGFLNGSMVCVKRIRVCSKDGPQKATKAFYQEVVVWKHLEHENIVPLLGITSTPLQLISEWMAGGDLTEYINKNSVADRLGLLSGVAGGLHYLHSRDIVHGDLKGSNILVDGAGHARITGFGLATVTRNLDSVRDTSGDWDHGTRWTPPEILKGEGTYSKEADVFSFAMVMIEVFTGAAPFNDSTHVAAVAAVMGGKRPPRPTHPTFTDELWALMRRCWHQDPRLRPRVSEVLKSLRAPPSPVKRLTRKLSYAPTVKKTQQEPPANNDLGDALDSPAWKRLLNKTLTAPERVSLITMIFSDNNQTEIPRHLSLDDAQTFVDMMDEVMNSLAPQIRRKFLYAVYRICDHQALVPQSLEIPLCYDPSERPVCYGGFADVWKGQYRGREVAAKVLRVHIKSDFGRIRRDFCKEVVGWRSLRHPNVIPLLGVTTVGDRFVMVTEWMVNGNINGFLKMNTDADRLELLRDVTKGLIYMHDEGIIHGNLKGTNILINNNGHACLTDFSLPTMASNQSTVVTSFMQGGTIQWMGPELLHPQRFGLRDDRPTEESDCYAMGMVIYEVLSGQIPFSPSILFTVIRKVLGGRYPVRPQGGEGKLFTDAIWRLLELCWGHRPSDRPSARAILLCLEGNPLSAWPSSNTDGGDRLDATLSESGSFSLWPAKKGKEAETGVIDILDRALDCLYPTSAAFRITFGNLLGICVSMMRLPLSHVLSVDLLNIGGSPFALGGYSEVSKGMYAGLEVCVKRLKVDSTSSPESVMLCREALIWRRLIHPNIVPFRGATLSPPQIISEWMSSGDLTTYINLNSDVDRVALLVDVANGLRYLHLCDVIHGDLKGLNIMVDASGCARITDFGLAQDHGAVGGTEITPAGTARWTAPEILQDKGTLSKEADVFSFAMVMIEVFTGSAPFHSHPSLAVTVAMMQGVRPTRPPHQALTDELWDLMQSCWHQDRHLRPGASEVLGILRGSRTTNAPSRKLPNVGGSTVLVAIQCERPKETKELNEKHESAHRCGRCQQQVSSLPDKPGNLDRSSCQNCGRMADGPAAASRLPESTSVTKPGVLGPPQRRRRLWSMRGSPRE